MISTEQLFRCALVIVFAASGCKPAAAPVVQKPEAAQTARNEESLTAAKGDKATDDDDSKSKTRKSGEKKDVEDSSEGSASDEPPIERQGAVADQEKCEAGSPEGSPGWCAFHGPPMTEADCGISDARWLSLCRTANPAKVQGQTTSGGAEGGCSAGAAEGSDQWCTFHYSRPECGVSDGQWVSLCKPPPASGTTATVKGSPGASADKPVTTSGSSGWFQQYQICQNLGGHWTTDGPGGTCLQKGTKAYCDAFRQSWNSVTGQCF